MKTTKKQKSSKNNNTESQGIVLTLSKGTIMNENKRDMSCPICDEEVEVTKHNGQKYLWCSSCNWTGL